MIGSTSSSKHFSVVRLLPWCLAGVAFVALSMPNNAILASQPQELTQWWRASHSGLEVRACLIGPVAAPHSAKITLVAVGGHDCGVSGPVRLHPDAKSLIFSPPTDPGCQIALRIFGQKLHFEEIGNDCSRGWCGTGLVFGEHTLVRDLPKPRKRCKD